MNCPTELSLSMFADGALEAHAAAEIDSHLPGCETCGARVAALRDEARMLRRALALDPATVAVPQFSRPASFGAVAAAIAATLAVAELSSMARGLIGSSVPQAVKWFNPFDVSGLVNLLLRVGIYLMSERGAALIGSIFEAFGVLVIGVLLWWGAAVLGRRIRGPLVMACLACAIALQSMPSHAVEIRHDTKGSIVIPAGETINDTLVAFGETVEVNGNVAGDLVAFGERVIVRGNVAGLVIAGGQNVTLDGAVDGSVLAGAESLEISSPRIGRNFFGGGESVAVRDTASIEQNVLVGGEKVALAGRIGRDVFGAATSLEVASTVGGALTAYTKEMTLLAPARIAGDVNAHGLERKDHVVVAPGAVIGGELKTTLDKMPGEENRYLTARFYGWELVWFAAAFIAGVAMLWLVPALRRVPFDGIPDALRAGGYGMVALVATPIIAMLACFTVVGIPIGVIAFMLWLIALYVAKLIVAQLVGARVIENVAQRREHFAVVFAVGLFVVTLVTNLPLVGGLIGFLVTLVGLGLLVLFVRDVVFDDPLEDD